MPFPEDPETPVNLAVESVRRGFATPKVFGNLDSSADNGDNADDGSNTDVSVDDYERQLQAAFQEAKAAGVGVHSASPPLMRVLKNSGDEFVTMTFVEQSKKLCSNGMVKCVIEHIFDGSRYRLLCTDEQMASVGLLHASFTLILAGIAAPRIGNPRLDPPTTSEPYAEQAKQFVEMRLLHRELNISLHGTDKSGVCAVGTVHHPKGNIGVELLKIGNARVSDWSARMMNVLDVPAFRVAENEAKVCKPLFHVVSMYAKVLFNIFISIFISDLTKGYGSLIFHQHFLEHLKLLVPSWKFLQVILFPFFQMGNHMIVKTD